jgi:hypothetical protein
LRLGLSLVGASPGAIARFGRIAVLKNRTLKDMNSTVRQ